MLYLVNKPEPTRRLARWILLLQEFDYSIVHKPGREHLIADYFSRLESGQLLTEGIFPEGITKDHRRKLVLRSATYSVIGGYLYKIGVD